MKPYPLEKFELCQMNAFNLSKSRSQVAENKRMKLQLLQGMIQTACWRRGLLLLAMGFTLATTGPAQLDDTKIAFTSERDGNREIYVMNPDGTNPIRLTTHPTLDVDPSWSPDGRKIAFSSNRDGNWEIYVMNADGTNLVNLTNHPEIDINPAWSPDGKKIAFASWRDVGDAEIYVMNADGKKPVRLTDHPAKDYWPAWSPVLSLEISPKGKLPTQWGEVKRSR